MSKQNKTDDFPGLPEWLAADGFGSETFELYTHPTTKAYLKARVDHDVARAAFDALEAELMKPVDEAASDLSLMDVDPRQEELESLGKRVGEAVERVNALAPKVRESAVEVIVTDKLTFDEIAALGDVYDPKGDAFYALLAELATAKGDTLSADGWKHLARVCGIGQWTSFHSDVLEYIGQPGVTPDFSPVTSPTPRE